jgi:hypothetical protein
VDLLAPADVVLELVAHGLPHQPPRLRAAAPQAGAALVAGDRAEPGRRLARLLPREQPAIRREECLLRSVLGLDRVTQDEPADAVDHPAVLLEERGDSLSGRAPVTAAGEREGAGLADRVSCR